MDVGGETVENEASGRIASKRSPLLRVLDCLSEEQFEEVVKDALAASGRAGAKSARQSLNAAINASPRIQINGFLEASKANKSPQLLAQVFSECGYGGNDRLLGAVLRMWMTCRQPLLKRVENHLAEIGVEPKPVDFREAALSGVWRAQDWDDQVESLLASSDRPADEGENDSTDSSETRRGETQLMFGLVSGAVMASPGEVKTVGIESSILLDLFEQLWSAPPTDPVWLEFDQGIEALAEIGEQTRRQIIDDLIEKRMERINHLSSEFIKELDFFEFDFAPMLALADDPAVLLKVKEDHADELIKLLERYRETWTRPEADSLREEKLRREERETLEREVATRFELWRSELAEKEEEVGPADSPETVGEDKAETECPDAAEAPDREIASLRERLKDEKSKRGELQTRYDSQREELRKWKRHSGKLDKDKQRLEAEIVSLRASPEERADPANQSGPPGARENQGGYFVSYSAQRVDSVRDAKNQAERSFPEELIFSLNAKSDLGTAFEKPGEVFNVLAWLAEDYRDGRLSPAMGGNRKELLEKKLKEACPNWSYARKQSSTTIGKNPDWYKTSFNGAKFDLLEHLKRGASRDVKATIRIGFAWDEPSGKVIVGYIGQHPKTGQS